MLFAAPVLVTPAQAHQTTRDIEAQTAPWGEPDPPEDADGAAEHDLDDPVDWDGVPLGGGSAADDPDDAAEGGEPNGVDSLDGAPDWDGLEQLPDGLPRVTSTFVPGTLARLRADGKASIPRGAPKRVRTLLEQINTIVGRRYKRGGGHARLAGKAYDCSGAVSYGLIKAGLLKSSMVSGRFARWGEAGGGRWVTIYASKGHVYMEVAGLRLDTSVVGDDPARTGVRWRPVIGRRDGFKVRHPAGL